MQLLRINFGQAVRIGPTTYSSLDLVKDEFKQWKAEINQSLLAIQITHPSGSVVLIPLGNVAYLETKADVSRSESSETPDGTRQERKGKARAT